MLSFSNKKCWHLDTRIAVLSTWMRGSQAHCLGMRHVPWKNPSHGKRPLHRPLGDGSHVGGEGFGSFFSPNRTGAEWISRMLAGNSLCVPMIFWILLVLGFSRLTCFYLPSSLIVLSWGKGFIVICWFPLVSAGVTVPFLPHERGSVP